MAGVYTELPSTLATDPRAGRASKANFRVKARAADFYRRLPMAPHVSRPPRFRGLVSEDSEEPSEAPGNNILTTPKVAPGHPGPRVGRRSVVFREFSIFRLRWTRDGDSHLWLHLGDREHALPTRGTFGAGYGRRNVPTQVSRPTESRGVGPDGRNRINAAATTWIVRRRKFPPGRGSAAGG